MNSVFAYTEPTVYRLYIIYIYIYIKVVNNIYIYIYILERERQKGREEREPEEKRKKHIFFILFDCVVYIILLSLCKNKN